MIIVSRVFSKRKRFRALPQPVSIPRKRPFPESSRVFPRPSVYPFVKAKPVFTSLLVASLCELKMASVVLIVISVGTYNNWKDAFAMM